MKRTKTTLTAEGVKSPRRGIVVDDDVHLVTPLNKFYWLCSKWQRALDELKAGDIGKDRMMRESQLYAKSPNIGSFDRKVAYGHIKRLARQAILEIVRPAPAPPTD